MSKDLTRRDLLSIAGISAASLPFTQAMQPANAQDKPGVKTLSDVIAIPGHAHHPEGRGAIVNGFCIYSQHTKDGGLEYCLVVGPLVDDPWFNQNPVATYASVLNQDGTVSKESICLDTQPQVVARSEYNCTKHKPYNPLTLYSMGPPKNQNVRFVSSKILDIGELQKRDSKGQPVLQSFKLGSGEERDYRFDPTYGNMPVSPDCKIELSLTDRCLWQKVAFADMGTEHAFAGLALADDTGHERHYSLMPVDLIFTFLKECGYGWVYNRLKESGRLVKVKTGR